MQTQGSKRLINAPLPHRLAYPQGLPPPLQVIIQTRAVMSINRKFPPLKPTKICLTQTTNLSHLQLNGNLPFQTTKV